MRAVFPAKRPFIEREDSLAADSLDENRLNPISSGHPTTARYGTPVLLCIDPTTAHRRNLVALRAWKANERLRPNRNHDAGLDVSPAVRDYLSLGCFDVWDLKFVAFFLILPGPLAKYGENNTFVKLRRHSVTSIASRKVTNNESISR